MWKVVFYRDRHGKCPPMEFIGGLPTIDQVKVYNEIRFLMEFGIQLGMPHARPIMGKLWELRPSGIRLFYFANTNRQFVILHGYRKQTIRAPEREIALRRMEEFLSEV